MPNRLRMPQWSKVDLVDQPADTHARIMLWKRAPKGEMEYVSRDQVLEAHEAGHISADERDAILAEMEKRGETELSTGAVQSAMNHKDDPWWENPDPAGRNKNPTRDESPPSDTKEPTMKKTRAEVYREMIERPAEAIAKAERITISQAVTKVLEQHPDAYTAYREAEPDEPVVVEKAEPEPDPITKRALEKYPDVPEHQAVSRLLATKEGSELYTQHYFNK